MTNAIPISSATLPAATPARPQPPEAQTKKVQKAARQFETQLLTTLLTALETSISALPGMDESGASEQYRTMATQGLASAWAGAGGIGIARMISPALSQQPKSTLPSLPGALPLRTPTTPALPAVTRQPAQAFPRPADKRLE